MSKPRAAGFIYSASEHHLDHIAPLCTLMDIPLLVTEKSILEQAERFYPTLIAYHIDELHLGHYIAKHFDVLFSCLPAVMLAQIFTTIEHLYNKKIISVWCPHGSSDKGLDNAFQTGLENEELALVYGQKMRDFFLNQNVFPNLKQALSVGNYRFRNYSNVKPLYIDFFNTHIQSQFHEQKELILYAPTWSDGIESSAFFDACPDLIENLPKKYNLAIKAHPNLTVQHMLEFERLMAEYQNHPSVCFIHNFPLIYPLLDKSAIYIGDRSSIGYDFLTFNRPMLFVGTKINCPLTNCGLRLEIDETEDLFDILEDHLLEDQKPFQQTRKQLYDYTFDPIEDEQKLAQQLHHMYTDYYQQEIPNL